VFASSFSTLLKDFVDVMVVWIAPWLAIYLVDWALRRFRYDAAALQRTDPGSIYWRTSGIHWPGIVAQLLGMVASIEALAATFNLPKWLHYVNFKMGGTAPGYGADLSIFTGMAVAALVYLLLAGAKVRREAALTSAS